MTTNFDALTATETAVSYPLPPVKATLWQAFKLSVISTIGSLPVLLFAFFLLLTQLMLLPKEAPMPTTGSSLGIVLPWIFCLLSIGCLSVLFQAGWMHLLVERTKSTLQLKAQPPQEESEPTTEKAKPAPELTVMQTLFSGVGQFGQSMLGYYAIQLSALILFIFLGAWVIKLIGIPAELQSPQMQQTMAQWLKETPSEAVILQTLQQWNPSSFNQISLLGMTFSISIIVLTLFVLFTSFLPSLIVTKQASLKTALVLQWQLIKQYPVQAVFISSFQPVGGCFLPLFLPRSESLGLDIMLYLAAYISIIWSQAFPIAYLLIQTDFPKPVKTLSTTDTPDLDITA
jgi:hypothetical protein